MVVFDCTCNTQNPFLPHDVFFSIPLLRRPLRLSLRIKIDRLHSASSCVRTRYFWPVVTWRSVYSCEWNKNHLEERCEQQIENLARFRSHVCHLRAKRDREKRERYDRHLLGTRSVVEWFNERLILTGRPCVPHRMQDEDTISRLIMMPLEGWDSSCTWERPQRFKILCRKKLRADWTQGMLAIIRCRIFCLPVCFPKIWRLRYTEL